MTLDNYQSVLPLSFIEKQFVPILFDIVPLSKNFFSAANSTGHCLKSHLIILIEKNRKCSLLQHEERLFCQWLFFIF